jgi:tetratricopeptide (TPR) repeat protein
MKRLNVSIVLLVAVFVSISLVGCSSKPYDELQMVRTAMDEARSKEAYEYAPNDWDRAQMDWQIANSLIQMGRYEEARKVLITAVGDYNNAARDESTRRIESLEIEIHHNLQSVLKERVATLQQATDDTRIDAKLRKRVEAALPFIDEKIAVMNTALDDKQYISARMYRQQAQRWINDLEKKLGIES